MTASGDEGPTKKPALPLRRLSTRVMASVPLPVPRPMLLDTPVIAALPLRSIQVASRQPPQETRPLDRTASVSTNDDHVDAVAPNAVNSDPHRRYWSRKSCSPIRCPRQCANCRQQPRRHCRSGKVGIEVRGSPSTPQQHANSLCRSYWKAVSFD